MRYVATIYFFFMFALVFFLFGYFWHRYTLDNKKYIDIAKRMLVDEIRWEIETGNNLKFWIGPLEFTRWRDGRLVCRDRTKKLLEEGKEIHVHEPRD